MTLATSTTPTESSINAGRDVSLTATSGTDRGDINRGDINLVGSVPVHRVRAANPSSAVAHGTDYTSALSRPVQARI